MVSSQGTAKKTLPPSPIKTLEQIREARPRLLIIEHLLTTPLNTTTSTWMIRRSVSGACADNMFDAKHIKGSTNANEALEISFIQAAPGSPRTLSSFHPQFTYPIFGDEERLFGYQNLKLNLRFAAHDLRPNLEVLYDKKFKPVGDTKATDIEETLKEWTPEGEEVSAVFTKEKCAEEIR